MQASDKTSDLLDNSVEGREPSTEYFQELKNLFKPKKTLKNSLRHNRLLRKKSGDVLKDADDQSISEEITDAEIKRDELLGLLELRKLTTRKQRGLDAEQLVKGDSKQLFSNITKETCEFEESQKSKKSIMESFTKQTNIMDVDKHMVKYIESQIEKLKSGSSSQVELPDGEVVDESLPEHLKLKSIRGDEGDVILSSSMLTAIPEVDLGIETQLKNIEETEIAKQALLEKSRSRERDSREEKLSANPYGLPTVTIRSNSGYKNSRCPITDEEALARFKKRFRR